MSESGRDRLRAVWARRRAVKRAQEASSRKTEAARARKVERKRTRKDGQAPVESLTLTPTVRKRTAVSRDVELLFRRLLEERLGVRARRWGPKEYSLAKKLVEDVGLEMSLKMVRQLVGTWPERVKASRGRLWGVPTMGLLWSLADSLQGELAHGNVPRPPGRSDEYSAEAAKRSGKVGW